MYLLSWSTLFGWFSWLWCHSHREVKLLDEQTGKKMIKKKGKLVGNISEILWSLGFQISPWEGDKHFFWPNILLSQHGSSGKLIWLIWALCGKAGALGSFLWNTLWCVLLTLCPSRDLGSCAQKGQTSTTAESVRASIPKLTRVHISIQQETPLYKQMKIHTCLATVLSCELCSFQNG